MEDIWNDFKIAVQEAERKGVVLKPAQRNNSELDMAVIRYRQEKEKQEKRARLFSY